MLQLKNQLSNSLLKSAKALVILGIVFTTYSCENVENVSPKKVVKETVDTNNIDNPTVPVKK